MYYVIRVVWMEKKRERQRESDSACVCEGEREREIFNLLLVKLGKPPRAHL